MPDNALAGCAQRARRSRYRVSHSSPVPEGRKQHPRRAALTPGPASLPARRGAHGHAGCPTAPDPGPVTTCWGRWCGCAAGGCAHTTAHHPRQQQRVVTPPTAPPPAPAAIRPTSPAEPSRTRRTHRPRRRFASSAPPSRDSGQPPSLRASRHPRCAARHRDQARCCPPLHRWRPTSHPGR